MCKKTDKWFPDFQRTWYKIDLEAYKIIYAEAKEKMEDVLSESESITNKSLRMIAALVTMFGFYIGFFVQYHIPLKDNLVFLLPFLIVSTMITILIFPKKIRGRGFEPKEFIPPKLDDDDDKGYQEQMLYYAAIEKLQEDIDFMKRKNNFRANIYLASLIGILVVFIACAINIAISLAALG